MARSTRRMDTAPMETVVPGGYMPPADPEAEQSVLGAILLRPQVLDAVADLLQPGDFYKTAHGHIYQAMLDLYGRGEPVDYQTVAGLLSDRAKLEEVGGVVFLVSLSEHVGFATNAAFYARRVHDKAVLRRLLDCTQEIAGGCLNKIEDVGGFLDSAEQKVFNVVESQVRQGFNKIGPLVHTEIALLEAIWQREAGLITGVPSGFSDLDNLTAGFQKGDLIIIAARPSMGKTALALNIAFNAAYKPQVPVALFSLEMSKEQLVRRLLSSVGQVDASNLRRAFLSNQEWANLQNGAGYLEDCPIYIDDTPAATVLDIRAKARRLKAEDKLGMVVIDYLQLMRGPANAPSREQEISEISRSLKALAKELNVPVMALSQLNREVEKRGDRRPILADLRESGAIEQDADVIIFIYRDEVYNKENSKEKGIAEIIVGKQRNGPTGKVKLVFRDKYTTFAPYEREEAPAGY